MNHINYDEKCTGCSACCAICPTNSIKLVEDEEGFFFPIVDEAKCISCKACLSVCQLNVVKKIADQKKQRAFVILTKNKEVEQASSSGGAFSEICRVFGEDAYFSGATQKGFLVQHETVNGLKNINLFYKSKYVQSNIGDTFYKIKKLLTSNKRVIFSGTPCQVSGLRNYLKRDYENLFCIDLVCHGVGSQDVFYNTIKVTEEDLKSKIVGYEFRSKRKWGRNSSRYSSCYKLENGNYIIDEDRYTQLFLNQLCLRKSCVTNCQFQNRNRQGDITLADFKNKCNIMGKGDYILHNYSTIIINTPKGEEAFGHLDKKCVVCEMPMVDAIMDNPIIDHNIKESNFRDAFFKDYKDIGKKKSIMKWSNKNSVSLKTFFKRYIPVHLQKIFYIE